MMREQGQRPKQMVGSVLHREIKTVSLGEKIKGRNLVEESKKKKRHQRVED